MSKSNAPTILFIFCVVMIMTVVVLIILHEGSKSTTTHIKSDIGYSYTVDTINGHTYFFDNTGPMEDHECKKCEERFIQIMDSIIDEKVIKIIAAER